MKINVIPLIDVNNLNSFKYGTEIVSVSGDAITLYFQLVDSQKTSLFCGYSNYGMRYIPLAGSTLQVTFLNVDDAIQTPTVRYASNPFADDRSIWSVAILPTDPFEGTINLKFILTENPSTTPITHTCVVRAVFESGVV
jgi:hypothetical protein